jgi:hypothetical protein
MEQTTSHPPPSLLHEVASFLSCLSMRPYPSPLAIYAKLFPILLLGVRLTYQRWSPTHPVSCCFVSKHSFLCSLLFPRGSSGRVEGQFCSKKKKNKKTKKNRVSIVSNQSAAVLHHSHPHPQRKIIWLPLFIEGACSLLGSKSYLYNKLL